MAKSKAQKAMAAGPSKIGAKARAAATALRGAGAMKVSETRHLQSQQFGGGRHRAKTSATSAKKNAYGTDYIGKHRSGESADRGPIVHV